LYNPAYIAIHEWLAMARDPAVAPQLTPPARNATG